MTGILDNLRATRHFRRSDEGREIQRRLLSEPFLHRIRAQRIRGRRLWATLGAIAALAVAGVIRANADHLALVAVAAVLSIGAGTTLIVALWVDLTMSNDVAALVAAYEKKGDAKG